MYFSLLRCVLTSVLPSELCLPTNFGGTGGGPDNDEGGGVRGGGVW